MYANAARTASESNLMSKHNFEPGFAGKGQKSSQMSVWIQMNVVGNRVES
jgi:hypothetical protein